MDTKISFLPGETTAVVRVHIVDDQILETAETLSVSLTESNIAVNGSPSWMLMVRKQNYIVLSIFVLVIHSPVEQTLLVVQLWC